MLIDHYGDETCFSYPKDRQKSQMLFSAKKVDIAETLRLNDNIKSYAEKLREESRSYDFGLNNSHCSSEDLLISLNQLTENHPMAWTTFFNAIFPYRKKSEHIKHKTDVLFQIFFTPIHNGQKKTPLHVSLCETIHDTCRYKKLIQILNRMGLGMRHDELEKTDVCLAERTIAAARPHRTRVSSIIKENTIIHGAMDNFDHEENTQSGKRGSHDTVLMLFQNSNGTSQDSQQIINRILDNITLKDDHWNI